MTKALLAAAVALLVTPAVGGRPASAANVTVTQVAASGSGGGVTIDREIEGLRESLVKRFAFSRYEFLSRKTARLAPGGSDTWSLANGTYLDIVFEGAEGAGAGTLYTLSLEVYKRTDEGKKGISKVTYKRTKGQPSLLGVGKLSSGASLILVITAE